MGAASPPSRKRPDAPCRSDCRFPRKKARSLTASPRGRRLERKALEEPVVLEILRTFEGSMLVKVQPAPPGRGPA